MTITAAAHLIITKIKGLYGNTRVPRHTTKADLIAIREEVQLLIDTLDDVEVGEE
jgi:hypothetical protein